MRFGFPAVALLALALQPMIGGRALAQSLGRQSAVATLPSTTISTPHERLLPLQGGQNFRDLGGYRTRDGRHVKWGLLFRSGSMHGLTATDYASLERRGIRVVCDFRDNRERAAQPVHWPAPGAPNVLFDDYYLDTAAMMPNGPPSSWTEDEAKATFAASYPKMLTQFNEQYRRMLAELLAGHVPLAFNCSAGKDRTGIAAALILTALGVPRQTVIDDYMLTNKYLDQKRLVADGPPPANMTPGQTKGSASADPATAMRSMSPGVLRAILAADPSYIEAAFAVLDHHEGGPEGYLRDELGVDHAALVRLRSLYLE